MRELDARANQLAHHLRALGVGPEVVVGLCVERSLEMVVGLIAILKAGGAYVPLDPEYPAERLDYMLAMRGSACWSPRQLPGCDRLPIAPGIKMRAARSRQARHRAAAGYSAPAIELIPQHLAYMIFTSGSTGKPKGAANTHRGLHNRLSWMQDAYFG